MSHTQNSQWLEAANEHFDEAVSQRNWSLARAVVADIEGYGFDASELRRRMNREMFASLPRNLKVKDLNEQVECPSCWEMPGKEEVEVEDSYSTRDCRTCEGTGMVDPQVNIFKHGAFAVLRSQVSVIEKGL
jgi:hypothetical protein